MVIFTVKISTVDPKSRPVVVLTVLHSFLTRCFPYIANSSNEIVLAIFAFCLLHVTLSHSLLRLTMKYRSILGFGLGG